MTFRRRRLWLGVAVLAASALVGCGRKAETREAAAPTVRPVAITVAELERRTVERTVEVVGTLRGFEEVTVGAKKAGRVLRVRHDIGDKVAPGEPLIELEVVDADLAIDQAKKRLAAELARLGLSDMPASPSSFDPMTIPAVVQARVSVERTQRNLERERSLNARKVGTYMDLQNAENDLDSARASLDNAVITARSTLASAQASQAALDAATQGRVDMIIRAPEPTNLPEGTTKVVYAVTKRNAHEGQWLKDGEAVCDLVISEPLKLVANIPERYAPVIAPDQTVKVFVASRSGEAFPGKVARINPSVDPVSRTFQVEALIPNRNGSLRPGGFAKARISTRTDTEAAVVPLESVVKFAGVTKIFVVEGKKARAIPVETGLEGKDWVEVSGSLPSRGQVVTSGQSVLADGTLVEIRGETPKPPDKIPDAH